MLRVSAVKELPVLSRMGEADALDREGASDDCGAADGSGCGCSRVAVGVSRVVIMWDPINQKSRICLGGSSMLVESRRVHERRLRPQTGCLIQRLLCYPADDAVAIQLHYGGA